MDYENMPVDVIYEHFCNISRQRVAQLIGRYKERGVTSVLEKMLLAREMLKDHKWHTKYGYSRDIVQHAQQLWHHINWRCGRISSYKDCVNSFESVEHLMVWGATQKGFGDRGFEIDKDILIKGNKVYSTDTCLIVPSEINMLFINCTRGRDRALPIGVTAANGGRQFKSQIASGLSGKPRYIGCYPTVEDAFYAYKLEKEALIASTASRYKHHIDDRAYDALMRYRVDITD